MSYHELLQGGFYLGELSPISEKAICI